MRLANTDKPTLRVIPLESYNAKWNMAADEYLMLKSEVPCLRFYQWQKPTLSFGRSQAQLTDLNFSTIKKYDLQGVIRKTGGKTVLHHHELTYSFTAPNYNLSILECYQEISKVLKEALADFGINCQMQEKDKQKNQTSICFKELSNYELAVNSKKLVGSAQKRQSNKVLQHGSLLLDIDFELWSNIWQINKKLLETRVTCCKNLLGRIPDLEKLTKNIVEKFAKNHNATIYRKNFTDYEKAQITNISNSYEWQEFEFLKEAAKENETKKAFRS